MTDIFKTSMRAAKAHIDKGDQAKEKSDQYYTSAGLELKVAQENRPRGLTMVQAFSDYGISKSNAYRCLAIADGRTTIEKVREDDATRKRKSRDVPDIRDTPPLITKENPEEPATDDPEEYEVSYDARGRLIPPVQNVVVFLWSRAERARSLAEDAKDTGTLRSFPVTQKLASAARAAADAWNDVALEYERLESNGEEICIPSA